MGYKRKPVSQDARALMELAKVMNLVHSLGADELDFLATKCMQMSEAKRKATITAPPKEKK